MPPVLPSDTTNIFTDMKFTAIFTLFLISYSSAFAQKVTGDWAQFGVYAEKNSRLETTPDVVFMGNSITEIWGDTVPEFFSENNYACRGISGQTSSQMLVRFRPDVINLHPKAVVICCGTNDIAENNGLITNENILNNIMSMCQLAEANGITPILCSILPCDHFKWRKDLKPARRIVEMNRMIKELAQAKGYEFVNYYDSMCTETGAMIPEYTYDRVHPTRKGYDVMMPIIQRTLKRVLAK